MKLSLLDRYKIIKHAVKAAFNPKTKMVLCFRVEHGEPKLQVSGVYPNGFKYVDPIFEYYSEIGSRSENLEVLNKRVASFNSLTVDKYAEANGLDRTDFGVLSKPVRYLPEETPIEEQPTVGINVKL